MTTRSFTGKTVVVTGAAGGIGAALVRRFSAEGAWVALLDRDERGATAVAEQLDGTSVMVRRCDVTSPADCGAAIGAVIDDWGGIDVLVNNAGITHLGRFRDTDLDVIRRVIDVNFFGSVNCTKAALPSLLERRGQIIVVSSVAGVTPLVGRTGYAASKYALHGFFDTLRAEHREDGLRVLVVCPSFVDTSIGAHALGADGGPPAPRPEPGSSGRCRPGKSPTWSCRQLRATVACCSSGGSHGSRTGSAGSPPASTNG